MIRRSSSREEKQDTDSQRAAYPGAFDGGSANPFPLLIGSEPPTGDRVGLYFGRTFNREINIPAETMFRDASVIMVPKVAIETDTRDGLMDIYGAYLRDRYQRIHDGRYWSVWKAKNPNA